MGFASKIAASQSQMANPPGGYNHPPSLQPGSYDQPQYQSYPGAPPQPTAGSVQPSYPAPSGSGYQYQTHNYPPASARTGPSPSQVYPGPSGLSQPTAPYQGYPQDYQPYQQHPYGYQYAVPQQSYERSAPLLPQAPVQRYGDPGQQYAPQQQTYNVPPYSQNPPYPGVPPRPGQPQGPAGSQYGPPGSAPLTHTGPATPQQVAAYRQLLISTIQEKRLQVFYPPERLDRVVQDLAASAPAKINKLVQEWNVPPEVATDVMKLALFDVVLFVDDSGSIEFEERGARKEQLKQVLGIIATGASTYDQDGISVRFMNSMEKGDGIRSAEDVERLVARVRFQGLTPLGTNLMSKVLSPMVAEPAKANRLEKPVLVIAITDGQPAGEPLDAVANSIRRTIETVSRTRYGTGAVSLQFSQVGNDQKARDFLGSLDEDPHIGQYVDCTSNFEVEQDEMSRANPPVYLTRELWCAKLMLGAIDASYDAKDEKSSGAGRTGGPPVPPSQYSGYSTGPNYNQPGYYSQPPAPGYGQPGPYSSGPPNQPPYSSGPPAPPQPGPQQHGPPQPSYGQSYGGYGAPPPQPPQGGSAHGQYPRPPPPGQPPYGQPPRY